MTDSRNILDGLLKFCLSQKLVVFLLCGLFLAWGLAVAPFDWDLRGLPRDPVPVDAIPNLGENQQIVFSEWSGRSPQDVEDQVTYPLTVSLLGVPGVREVRSQSMFGVSSIFMIFDDDIEFYWSRARIIEKLNSLPAGMLPDGVQPALGPDATALGQVYWYSLEGRSARSRAASESSSAASTPLGGWDLQELRSVQDWYVRYGLLSAEGISEVASLGGHVKEYHVDVHPDAMRAHNVSLGEVYNAVRKSNLDVGAGVTEINRVEYIVRGVGFITELSDLEQAVVKIGSDHVPIRVKDVATVSMGPAARRGALTISGAEAVGGVVVVREGYNPLQAIHNVKDKIEELRPGLPAKAVIDWDQTDPDRVRAFADEQDFAAFDEAVLNQEAWVPWLRSHSVDQWPAWVDLSQVEIVSFYDRTGLIYETLGTLNDALIQQILVTIVVVLIMMLHLRSALIISAMLPFAVLMCFIMMKLFGVDSNVVALAGIAIAIGTIVDMGVIVVENVLKHFKDADPDEPRIEVVFRGTREVGTAILTAISTTIISFLPVFTMTGAEGKMFIPLAFTKTFVLFGSIVAALTIVPVLLLTFVGPRFDVTKAKRGFWFGTGVAALVLIYLGLSQQWPWVWGMALALLAVAILHLVKPRMPAHMRQRMQQGETWIGHIARVAPWVASALAVVAVGWMLSLLWEPLGPGPGRARNFVFVAGLIGGVLGIFLLFQTAYGRILRWCLAHKAIFLTFPVVLITFGLTVWLGFDRVFGWIPAGYGKLGGDPQTLRISKPWSDLAHEFPGLGRQFMPALDEGSFLWMPTTMPHASIEEILDVLTKQDMAISAIPEVELVAGKIGRAESALDPAPLSMIESVIHYKSEYIQDANGRRVHFKYDRDRDEFVRDKYSKELIVDSRGRPYRQWREHIRSPSDIWNEITAAAALPGTTSAPPLQPIETRLVMLQTGMRAPMGLKVRAPDLETLDRMAVALEGLLREAPGIRSESVTADRVVGKPYLEIHVDRERAARYGLNVEDVQDVISTAIGGRRVTSTVEGRERYDVRVRYPRELRNTIEDMERVLVPTMTGAQVPLMQLADIRYTRGPQMIRSEDTFLTAFVTFGPLPGFAEVDVVEQARDYLLARIEEGAISVPPGVSWRFAGDYEHQIRAMQTLMMILPVSLVLIFLILYFQFRSVPITLTVFSGIAVAWAGGFVMIYFYGQDWFANFHVFGVNMRDLFQLHAVQLSVAVWVGFLALFGIAVDDGVVLATYLKQSFAERRTRTVAEIREATVAAGLRRVRPCLMTSATTILALLPVLTSTGRGADIMIPMAIPSVGGMSLVLLSMFTVPVLFCLIEELRLKREEGKSE